MSVPAYTKRITFLLSGITGTSNMEDRLKNQGLFNLIWQLHGYSCENLFFTQQICAYAQNRRFS